MGGRGVFLPLRRRNENTRICREKESRDRPIGRGVARLKEERRIWRVLSLLREQKESPSISREKGSIV